MSQFFGPGPTFLMVFIIVSIVSFFFHLIWEFSQCIPFFVHGDPEPSYLSMIQATLGDVLLTWISYLGVALISKNLLWILEKRWKWSWMFTLICIAFFLSITIEVYALRTGRWSYTDINPLFLNRISIVPVLQLLILFPATFFLSRVICQKFSSR